MNWKHKSGLWRSNEWLESTGRNAEGVLRTSAVCWWRHQLDGLTGAFWLWFPRFFFNRLGWERLGLFQVAESKHCDWVLTVSVNSEPNITELLEPSHQCSWSSSPQICSDKEPRTQRQLFSQGLIKRLVVHLRE